MTLTSETGTHTATSNFSSIFGGVEDQGLGFYGCWIYLEEMEEGDVIDIKVQVFDAQDSVMRTYKESRIGFRLADKEPAVFVPFIPSTRFDVLVGRTGIGGDFVISWELLTQPQV